MTHSSRAPRPLLVTSALCGLLAALLPLTATAASAAVPEQAKVAAAKTPKPEYPGTPPMWVVHPYVAKDGKRAQISAKLYVDPFRRPGADKKKHRNTTAIADKVTFSVAVAKQRYANPKRPRAVNALPASALLADLSTTKKVSKRGVVTFKVTLGSKASRVFLKRSYKQRLVSTAITVEHRKDTFKGKKHTAKWGAKQINDAALTKSKALAKQSNHFLKVAKKQVGTDRNRVNVVPDPSGAKLSWAGASPMYNYVYVTNSTPFVQQVQFNPNIQCMWSGGALNPPAALGNIAPGATMQLTYVADSIADAYGSEKGWDMWMGINGATVGMNAPGTQQSMAADLVNAGSAVGQGLLDAVENPEFYDEAGIVAAAGRAVITFLIDYFNGDPTTCTSVSTYPELMALNTTVVGFGTDNQQTATEADFTNYPPSTWSQTQPIVAPTDTQYWTNGQSNPSEDPSQCVGTNGTNANGQNCYWTGTTQVGVPTAASLTSTYDCPADATNQPQVDWCNFLEQTLQPMLGAQTSATYYWNGGQPAYMVSNNAESTDPYVGGATNFTGGLFQTVGPNPGLPGDAWCYGTGVTGVENCSYGQVQDIAWLQNYNPMGAMNFQLTYLSNPNFQAGMTTQSSPVASVSAVKGTPGEYEVTCTLPSTATLTTPFGAGGSTTSIPATALANSNTTTNASGQTPKQAQWLVNFYGLDSDGNFVYFNDTPGTQPPSGVPQSYSLSPNAPLSIVPFNEDGAQQQATGYFTNSNLDNMQTLSDIQSGQKGQAKLASIGCSAVPQVQLPGLDVANPNTSIATNFGQIDATTNQGWPMPGNHTGWPTNLYSPYDQYTNYEWQWPVEQLNVSFQGVTGVGTTSIDCTLSSCSP